MNALFRQRLHVLRAYARQVVRARCAASWRAASRRGAAAGRRRKLLMRHPAMLAEEARRRLRELLDRYEVLRRVIEYA